MSQPRRSTAFERTVQRGAAEVAQRLADAAPRYATPDEAVEQSQEWTNAQLTCRTKGHDFTEGIDVVHYTRARWYWLLVECSRHCGVKQEQHMNARGHVFWSRTIYPPRDGSEGTPYLSRHGRVVGDAKDAVRLEMVLRVLKPRKSQKQAEPHTGWEDDEAGGDGRAEAVS